MYIYFYVCIFIYVRKRCEEADTVRVLHHTIAAKVQIARLYGEAQDNTFPQSAPVPTS